MARKIEFDKEKVIAQALDVFWNNGFEKSSLKMLSTATNLHKGSLYGTFKSKEDLFSLCIERYVGEKPNDFVNSGLKGKEYIEMLFLKKLNSSSKRKAKGCLLMNSCIELSNSTGKSGIKKLNKLLDKMELNFEEALKSGVRNHQFSKKVDVKKSAEQLIALAFTIEEMGKLGKSRDFLQNIANGSLSNLDIEI